MSIENFIARLSSGSAHKRREAAEQLGVLGDARAVEPLSKVLMEDKAVIVRLAAASALGKMRDPSAVEPLISTMKEMAQSDLDVKQRIHAIQTLWYLGPIAKAAKFVLIGLLDDVTPVTVYGSESEPEWSDSFGGGVTGSISHHWEETSKSEIAQEAVQALRHIFEDTKDSDVVNALKATYKKRKLASIPDAVKVITGKVWWQNLARLVFLAGLKYSILALLAIIVPLLITLFRLVEPRSQEDLSDRDIDDHLKAESLKRIAKFVRERSSHDLFMYDPRWSLQMMVCFAAYASLLLLNTGILQILKNWLSFLPKGFLYDRLELLLTHPLYLIIIALIPYSLLVLRHLLFITCLFLNSVLEIVIKQRG